MLPDLGCQYILQNNEGEMKGSSKKGDILQIFPGSGQILDGMCHDDAMQPSYPLSSPSLPALIFPSIRVFLNESVLHIRWPKYWSFSFNISPSNEHPRTDLFQDGLVGFPCSPRNSQESPPKPQFKSINSLALSFLYSPTLTSIHDYWKNHSFDETDLCWQSNVSAF